MALNVLASTQWKPFAGTYFPKKTDECYIILSIFKNKPKSLNEQAQNDGRNKSSENISL
jgi:hypothetical protein